MFHNNAKHLKCTSHSNPDIKDYENPLNNQSRAREIVLLKPRWALLYIIAALVIVGLQVLFYFSGDWIPFSIKISVTIFLLLLTSAHFPIAVSRKGLPPIPKGAFKPYWFWYLLLGSIGLTVLSWGVALFFYNLMWFLVALGTTMFMLVSCWVGIQRAVQQMEPTSDIV